MAALHYANGGETNRAAEFRFYVHGETATSSKNVQSEVREVQKVLHKHTHPEQFPDFFLSLFNNNKKKVIDDNIRSVWSFLDL